MLEPIPFAGMVEIDESFDRTASHMAGEYVAYKELTDEEITNVLRASSDYVEFARAVIKLAQEK
jgi:hypothetical protein